ncbi:MAG TPA: hypothetical protein VFG71_01710 [Nitrospiraceae bacterium]|nr:hypothetical protein [Nitrospiraceae bacterium]
MVKSFILTIAFMVALSSTGAMFAPEEAIGSTTFTKVSVQAVDQSARSLTFRTTEGQTWTLIAASPDILNDLHTGDICSLEIDSEDRVTKIVKAGAP